MSMGYGFRRFETSGFQMLGVTPPMTKRHIPEIFDRRRGCMFAGASTSRENM
jgi:hypothetical protein